MNEEILLSVIIPACNAQKYLPEAIESIRSQKWERGLEIIVVDDGSSDNTADIAKKSGCVVISVPNGGAASARNIGIKAAKAEYISFLDADDLYTEDALWNLFSPFEKDASVYAVFGMTKDFISPDLTPDQSKTLAPRTEPYTGMLTGSVMIRKSILEKVGCFDCSMRSGETVDWLMRIREFSLKTIQLQELTALRRLHMTNTGRVNRMDEMKNYAALLRKRMNRS